MDTDIKTFPNSIPRVFLRVFKVLEKHPISWKITKSWTGKTFLCIIHLLADLGRKELNRKVPTAILKKTE